MLALGIGANSAVFTLFDQVLLRMLPVERPKELVRFEWSAPSSLSRAALVGTSATSFVSHVKDLSATGTAAFSGMLAACAPGRRLVAQSGGE